MTPKKISLVIISLCLALSLSAGVVQAKQTVTDQLGRQVVVPDKAQRMVVLMHQALDMLLQLGAEPQIAWGFGTLEKVSARRHQGHAPSKEHHHPRRFEDGQHGVASGAES
jgi:ABC-type Fe3+-hydroxamate transport system substrate-binding protein